MKSKFLLKVAISYLIISFSIALAKGQVEGFGDGLEAIVYLPTHHQGRFAVPGFAGFAYLFAVGGFALGAGQ
ncbi:hypothetical protein VB780_16630 [Leptolyngbya sp. CCNP1308]|uniref:hypothetical protein n=1 Tax=Leptolyngbya sp. CCNP1308 TaxID=3110255 RepID=UPI002B20BE7D|nr:hypothetical protein [Leptolyngbya sp. CCNP1308]MEA5450208.1 hypothetical protein [Leptolyngbya sp. CCNP1308]